jgi:hypothetical protein
MNMAKVMGYQGGLFYGTKGGTAATRINARVDVSYEIGVETGSTTSAGAGTSVPINTGEATALTPKITFNMIVADDDAAIVALMAAAATGNPIALRYIRATGLTGFDCDCIISITTGSPLKGEATVDVSVEQVSASLRTPILNA